MHKACRAMMCAQCDEQQQQQQQQQQQPQQQQEESRLLADRLLRQAAKLRTQLVLLSDDSLRLERIDSIQQQLRQFALCWPWQGDSGIDRGIPQQQQQQ